MAGPEVIDRQAYAEVTELVHQRDALIADGRRLRHLEFEQVGADAELGEGRFHVVKEPRSAELGLRHVHRESDPAAQP